MSETTRRTFLALSGAAALLGTTKLALAGDGIKAIGFDGFTIYDPRRMLMAAKERFPDKGEALGAMPDGEGRTLSDLADYAIARRG